jgi:peptidoglycan/LPS O-acetylase OafA/YrhL
MKHIKPLTSLRFFFSLMVFLSHLNPIIRDTENTFLNGVNNFIFYEGYLGVSFFFILSGFILSYTYQEKLIGKLVTRKSFWINRITRIYPLHLSTLILSLPIILWNIDGFRQLIYITLSFLFNLTLTQSFVPLSGVYFSFNGPSWSISNELFFYLLTPFLFSKLYNVNLKKVIIVILVFVLTIILGVTFIPQDYHHSVFYINPIIRLFDFILGIFLYSFFKSFTFNLTLKNSSFLEFVFIGLFVLFFLFHDYVPQVYRYSIYYWIPMVGLVYIFSISKGIFSIILSKNIFVYLGEISFGFYLIHQLVIRYSGILIRRLDINLSEITHVFFVLIVSLVLSILSFEFFENRVREPMKNVLRKYLFRS